MDSGTFQRFVLRFPAKHSLQVDKGDPPSLPRKKTLIYFATFTRLAIKEQGKEEELLLRLNTNKRLMMF